MVLLFPSFLPWNISRGHFVPRARERKMTYYPSFEWLKMKKGIFLGLEIPRDCLHLQWSFRFQVEFSLSRKRWECEWGESQSFSREFRTPAFFLTSWPLPWVNTSLGRHYFALLVMCWEVITQTPGGWHFPNFDKHLSVEWICVYKPSPLPKEYLINTPLWHIEHLEQIKENSQVINEEEIKSVY